MKRVMCAVMALMLGLVMSACSNVGTVVSTIGGNVYTTASAAVTDYCSKTPAERALIQLVVAGKVYNSGVCDVVNSDVSLQAQLATAAQDKAAELISDKIASAVSDGKLTAEQAALIQTSAVTPAEATAAPPASPAHE